MTRYLFLIVVDVSGEFGGDVVCIFGEAWLIQNTDVPPKRTKNRWDTSIYRT